jgi:aminopeptidase N
MHKFFVFISFCIALCCSIGFAQTPYNPHIDVLHYQFKLELNDKNNEILGEATIELAFKTSSVKAFQLDFIGKTRIGAGGTPVGEGMKVYSVQEESEFARFTHDSNRITIYPTKTSQTLERRRYTITYRGIPADGLIISKNKFGDRTFFGDNWAVRARHWLPTVDHPSDKATCEFLVTAPNRYQVISNGVLVEESDVDSTRRQTHWRESTPIATKLMVIGVAQFSVQRYLSQKGKHIESWVFPQNRTAGLYDYAQAAPILDFFEQHIGEFAYEKLANVQSKTRYGGMENASAIFYAEEALDGKRSNETLFAHEIAHQWFGDAVSESDWQHIWLSESFATYFADVYYEHRYGRDRMVQEMSKERVKALKYAKAHPTDPIVDTVSAVKFETLLSPLVYEKGAWVLHGLRKVVGDDAFWNGIRTYYLRFKNGNASTNDFRQVMEKASGLDLRTFFRQWLYTPAHPTLQYSWTFDSTAKNLTLLIRQAQMPLFEMPLDIGIYSGTARMLTLKTLQVREKEQTFTIPCDAKPSELVIDPHSWLFCEVEAIPENNANAHSSGQKK